MGFLEEHQRPDLLGVIMVTTAHPSMGKLPMLIERRAGAMGQLNVQRAIAKMRQSTAVVVMTPQGRQVLRQLRPPRVSRRMQLAQMSEQLQASGVEQQAG